MMMQQDYTRKQLIQMWNECATNGKFYTEFQTKQMRKHGRFIIMLFDWLKLLNNGKQPKHLSKYTADEIVYRYELAKWMTESYDKMTFHKCQICNKVNFYIEDENDEHYYDFNMIKARCHTLISKNYIGYGSKLDMFDVKDGEQKLKIDICDDCLADFMNELMLDMMDGDLDKIAFVIR